MTEQQRSDNARNAVMARWKRARAPPGQAIINGAMLTSGSAMLKRRDANLERKVRVPIPPDGKLVDGVEVPVLESTERWSEVKLEDGSVLRVKPVILSAVRIPGQYDPEGNPMYALKANNAMMIAEAPEHLKRQSMEGQKKAN
jgi:hypothetical protein